MSQRDALRALDASIIGAFKDAGLADAGSYTAPGGSSAVACDVIVDRDLQIFAEAGADIAIGQVVVSLLLAQVAPERGGVVIVDGDSLTLSDELDRDASRSRWVARA